MIYRLDINGVAGPIRVLYIPANEKNPNCEPRTTTKATVEFYDLRYPHTPDGQFTGGYYYVDTIMGRDGYSNASGGLDLMGNVSDWKVDARWMGIVRDWISYLEYNKP